MLKPQAVQLNHIYKIPCSKHTVLLISEYPLKSKAMSGYNTTTNFFAGITNNASILSWNGQTGNLTYKETLNYLYTSYIDNIIFPPGNTTTRFLLPFGFCKVQIQKLTRFLQVKITPSKVTMEHLFIVSDPNVANPFQVFSPAQGNKIKIITSPVATKYVEYKLELKETRVEADDGTCAKYPYKKHKSYHDCVEVEMSEKIVPVRGCMIPWMSNNNQCTAPIPRLPADEELLQQLYFMGLYAWGGIQYKSDKCPVQCTTITAHSAYQVEGGGFFDNVLEFYIDDYVHVEKVRHQ